MRVKNIIKNMNVSIISSIVTTLFNFIVRTMFIQKLGNDYLGLNSILINILSMLSIAELGIGTAIGFSLYKPLAENDENKIKILMNFYKKAYSVIGIIILLIGLLLIPFLNFFINNSSDFRNFYLIYVLYLLNTVYPYFFAYKRTLIIADQKNYILKKYLTFFSLIIYVAEIIYLTFKNNFEMYLIIQFSIGIIENIYINYKLNHKYKYLKEKVPDKLNELEKKSIFKNVKAMFFHKVGDYCINSTDNLIMSHFINIAIVGIYSNYYTIIYTINSFLYEISYSVAASFGNLIASENEEVIYKKFKTFNFLSFWIYGWASLCLYFLLTPFITTVWLNDNYLINSSVITIVLLNYFISSMGTPLIIVKSGGGIYDQDKYVPIIQSIVNLIFSVILVQKIGLLGVFLGTLISNVGVVFWARPYIVYKNLLKKPLIEYFKNFFTYFSVLILTALLIKILFNFVIINNNLVYFVFKVFSLLIIPNIIFYVIFKKSKEFINLLQIIKDLMKDRFKKNNYKENLE